MAYEAQKQIYRDAQRKLTLAAEERSSVQRALASYQQSYAKKNNQVNQDKSEKSSLEKRLQQVIEIISLLGGSVPSNIIGVNSAANTAGKTFSDVIRCSGIASCSLGTAFYTKSVDEDFHTSNALTDCRTEKDRIETRIEQLAASIRNLEEELRTLSGNISTQNNRIISLNNYIRNYESTVNQYRKYINM